MAKIIDFEALVPKIVESLLATVVEKHASNQWISATFTKLMASDGQSAMSKLRINLVDSNIDAALGLPREIRVLISNTWDKMFKKNKKKIWFGLKLTAYSDGKYEVEYNYEPNCIDDPKFIDW